MNDSTNTTNNCTCENLTPHLSSASAGIMFTIISFQIIGAFSNMICIHMVSRMRNSSLINRPKIFMANIAFSDTILTFVSFIPRFLIIAFIIDKSRMTSHIIQSLRVFLENLTLYVEAFTMVVIAWDRFYALTRVFNNPFDQIATKKVVIIVWTSSVVLSLPFLITSEVDYYDYKNHTVTCIDDKHYLYKVNQSPLLRYSRQYITLIFEFVIPTIVVTWFSSKIIFHLFDVYRNSVRGVRMTACIQRCEVTKRLITILFIFIMKNIAYIVVTKRWQILHDKKNCDDQLYFIFYEIFRVTNPMNSVIFFWLSSEFRFQLRYYVCDSTSRSRTSSREAMINVI